MMLHLMLRHLHRSGWETLAIVADGMPTRTTVDGVEVVIPADKHLLHELFQSADVVITHLGGTPRARGMATLYSKPLVQLIHNTSEYSEGFLGDGCDFAIYNSYWVSEYHESRKSSNLIKVWQRPKMSWVKQRRCFEWPSMVCRPPVLDSYPGFGAGVNGYITLINLVPNKGPDVFYEVAARNPDLKFMAVIGGYQPGDQVIKELPNVRIRDHTPDISTIYSETSLLLVPSIYESYGLVAVEAMGRGIPVIASPTPGLKECLGPDGIFCDREDIDAWCDAIRSILKNYDSLSETSRLRYSQLWSRSQQDLELLESNMRKVIEEWHSSLLATLK